MAWLNSIGDGLLNHSSLIIVTAIVFGVWIGAYALLLRRSLPLDNDQRLPRQMILLGLIIVGIIAIVMALPVPSETRNQLLTVLGLLGSALVGLSSTTLVSNAVAGLMLRVTHSFRTGDFIRVESHFGRVSARGLLDTEIQTENRELTMLPNLYLIQKPVTVVRTSGTIITVDLSLGYDVHYSNIEPCLLQAAHDAELEEPFVRIMELGNYAITYRIAGFLNDVKNLLTVRSKMHKAVIDQLHSHEIEIVSPTFMNQRQIKLEQKFMAVRAAQPEAEPENGSPEEIMFDKAEEAEKKERTKIQIQEEIAELEEKLKNASGEHTKHLKEHIATLKEQLKQHIKEKQEVEEKTE